MSRFQKNNKQTRLIKEISLNRI